MILKRLILPGQFVQAHPYFDTLWLLRMDGTLQAFDILQYANRRLNGSGSAAMAVFARNDQLRNPGEPIDVRAQRPDVQKLLRQKSDIEVSAADVDEFSYIFPPERMLEEAIDLKFYSGRAYASTDAGLVVFNAQDRDDLSRNRIGSSSRKADGLDKWIDAMPLQIQARLGTVNASCGEAGGHYATGANSTETRFRPQMRKFAETSFASEFTGDGVANIVGPVELDALRASKVLRDDSAQVTIKGETFDPEEIVEIDEAPDEVANRRFQQAIQTEEGSEAYAYQAFVTTRRAFVHFTDGSMSHFAMAYKGEFSHGRAQRKPIEGPGSRILSMSTTAGRVIAECKEDVHLLSNNEWNRIYDGPVFSVRGYPQSKWYKQIVTIVGTDHVELLVIAQD